MKHCLTDGMSKGIHLNSANKGRALAILLAWYADAEKWKSFIYPARSIEKTRWL